MTRDELKNILDAHKVWLFGTDGRKADLRNANLNGADLRNANLSGADLMDSDLIGADLSGANLRHADLRDTNLSGDNLRYADRRHADLSNADLSGANLRYADLSYAYLSGADLSDADLRYSNLMDVDLSSADLRGANLSGADLMDADLRYANLRHADINYPISCPEKGSFIGFKKCRDSLIVELEITDDSLRCSATGRKCRCSKAKVISITNLNGTPADVNVAHSVKNYDFIYKVGEIIEVKDFDTYRWNECSTGIHFFTDRNSAVNYNRF